MGDGPWRPMASDVFAATATPGMILGALLVLIDGVAALRTITLLLLLAAPVTGVVHGIRTAQGTSGAPRVWWSAVAYGHTLTALVLLAPWARQSLLHDDCDVSGFLPAWTATPRDLLLYTGWAGGLALPLTVIALGGAAVAFARGHRQAAGWLAVVFPSFWISFALSVWLPGCPML